LVYYREGSEMPDPDYDHMFKAMEEEVAKFQATDQGSRFWGLRVVWSTMRSQDPRSIIEDADSCIATKIVWPHLVAGYDLADSENLGRPLADLLPELFWFRKQCAVEEVQIPFFLRAEGSLGDNDKDATTESDLFDALLLGTRRVGHATSLHKHPRLVEAIRDRRILVEIRPVSKEGLDPSADVVMHDPLEALLAQGVHCALCGDDSGILPKQEQDASSRMTDIFWQVLQAGDGMDLATLGSLAENSVRWAAFEDQDAETWYVPQPSFSFDVTFAWVVWQAPKKKFRCLKHCPLPPPNPAIRALGEADKITRSRASDIRAASVGAGVKAARLQQWAVEWERFCLWIVTEYGDAYDGGNGGNDGGADAPNN
jgi:adenosine deaminase CECR1